MLLNINTVALRQAVVPPRLYGRVVSVAQVLALSAIPLGSLAGAAAINMSGSVTGVYAVIGGLTAAIALAFAFSPVAHGDRYLAEAAERPAGPRALDIRLDPRAPSARAGHGPGSRCAGPARGSADAGRGADGSKEVR
jgi:hypothetical protein